MEQTLLRSGFEKVLGRFADPRMCTAIVAFAQFLSERRQGERETTSQDELSATEHTRILHVLDAVAVLSSETGPPVSNRDHDRYLYGKD